MFTNLSPDEFKKMMEENETARVIDVREKWEYHIVHITGAELFPLSQIKNSFSHLNVDDTLLVYCHLGSRSIYACNFLAGQGFKNIFNLDGGIDAWQHKVEPHLAVY